MEYRHSANYRLYIEHDLSVGTTIRVEGSRLNYLINVLRMKDGEHVLLFNGRHGEWLGEIMSNRRKTCHIKLLNQTRVQPEPYDLTYIFAPLKRGRLDYMAQKAVEMGAGILQPAFTCYAQVSRINMQRLWANTVEAAEQCGILSVPRIAEPRKLNNLITDWNRKCPIIFCDETNRKDNIIKILSSLEGQKLALLIGPEGGFSKEERESLHAMPFVHSVSLGPRILRSDTAAVAALAVLQAVAGDWRKIS